MLYHYQGMRFDLAHAPSHSLLTEMLFRLRLLDAL